MSLSGSVHAAAPAATTAKRPLIVLDAGHGGEDPGAIGPNGTREKEINLAIVRELKRLFEEDGRFDVALTRTDDTFIPLVERTSMANDLASGRSTEIDALCGEVVRLARDHGTAARVNERISERVRAWPRDPRPMSAAQLRAALGV